MKFHTVTLRLLLTALLLSAATSGNNSTEINLHHQTYTDDAVSATPPTSSVSSTSAPSFDPTSESSTLEENISTSSKFDTPTTVSSRPRHRTPTTVYTSIFQYACPPDFLRLGNGCYYFSKEMATWTIAHFECRAKDSQLMAIETAWEDGLMRRHLSMHAMTRLNRWIGGIYDWSQEEWVWGGSGDVMHYRGFLKEATQSRRWQCAYMAPELYYRWQRTQCTHTMHYICEAPFTRMPRPV
ncbi:collectin-12 [Hyalella azteca]|uniref:Collectin-12 n=1 Tax=Hyalella azteca TaxID=294128 RepID=A0A8B7MZ81_HYAAZ|nr:collectin-12 [Hyalella azteca]